MEFSGGSENELLCYEVMETTHKGQTVSVFLFSFLVANSLQSPYKKLKEALSSVETFEKHYLVGTVQTQHVDG